MITLNDILTYMTSLVDFYGLPFDTHLKFCLHADGSCSIHTQKKTVIASFDTIEDLQRIVLRSNDT